MFKKYNLAILITPLLLFTFGYITLLSTSTNLIRTHLIHFFVGLLLYYLFSRIDFKLYQYFWLYIYISAVFLLLLTYIFAELQLGAARWLQLGPFSFQTSEYAKLALIISLAYFISQKGKEINRAINLLKIFLLVTPIVLFVFLQPDLGTSGVIAATSFGIVFYGGLSVYYVLIGLLGLGIASAPLWNLLKDYQKRRILVFLNPQMDVLGSGYNVIQSIIAVGSGGIWGKGFGRGTQANLEFLPAYWTDFIFASFAEEWGFVGVALLVTTYTIFLAALIYTAYRVKSFFGRLIIVGIFFIFLLQFLINVGMNLGIMPVTGVTLPFVSYGGTSMVFSFISLGIIQNIWKKDREPVRF